MQEELGEVAGLAIARIAGQELVAAGPKVQPA
jgi:hypothetical protein